MTTSKILIGVCFIIFAGIFDFAKAVPQWRRGLNGYEYLIEIEQKYNWFEASHLCASQNLHLVEIDSEKKNTDLIHVLKIYPGSSRNLWLGANDEFNQAKDKKRAFYWSSGKKMVFNFWSIENPNNAASNEHCAHIWHSKANFEWNDNVCTNKMGYICEKEIQ